MANRADVEKVLARVNKDLQRPVPISTDAFGNKTLSQDAYQIGITLDATKRLLDELLASGLSNY